MMEPGEGGRSGQRGGGAGDRRQIQCHCDSMVTDPVMAMLGSSRTGDTWWGPVVNRRSCQGMSPLAEWE
jgi:hypothetical protein